VKLTSLPLFPLGSVLYPDGLLSLQVFEVRYLDMVGRCHKTKAPFGVVLLTEGSEVLQRNSDAEGGDVFAPQVFQNTGTLAQLTAFSNPQAGLQVIQCEGVQRFTIDRREKLKHGLWVADVTLMDADQTVPIPSDLQGTAHALRQLVANLEARKAPNGPQQVRQPHQFDDCAWVSNRWCELLPIPGDLKQRMLELDNPLLRLELVGDILTRTGIAT
jgi:Lon protease-like protein